MLENSLLLFKPEAFQIAVIFEKTEEMLISKKIQIISKRRVILDRNQVLGIWERRCFDPFTYYMMLEAYENKEFELWLVQGENAIENCKVIKKKLRSLYSPTFICNGVHSPGSEEEYKENLSIITEGKTFVFPRLFFSLSDTVAASKRKISQEELIHCAHEFIHIKEEVFVKSEKPTKKNQVVVRIDNVHWLTEYAVILYNCFPTISLLEAYIYATIIVEFSEAVIYVTDDRIEAEQIVEKLRTNGLLPQVKFEEEE